MKARILEETTRFAESVLITSMCGMVMVLGIEFVMTFG
jgi:hypothetical protein